MAVGAEWWKSKLGPRPAKALSHRQAISNGSNLLPEITEREAGISPLSRFGQGLHLPFIKQALASTWHRYHGIL
jgi:hypothetical protein